MTRSLITTALQETRNVLDAVIADDYLLSLTEKAGEQCIAALKADKKILLAGNGGSAADAQHIAAELVSRLRYDRPGLAAIALTTDTSALTAIGNDYGYDYVFARQVEAIGQTGDVLIVISTSGNSASVLAAATAAKKKGIFVIGLTGQTGGKLAPLCDIPLCMPSTVTAKIQECHIMFGHIICQIIEDTLFGAQYGKK